MMTRAPVMVNNFSIFCEAGLSLRFQLTGELNN